MANTNLITNDKQISTALASHCSSHELNRDEYRRIASELMNESSISLSAAKANEEEAKKYLIAADAMEKLATAVRRKAAALIHNVVLQEEAIDDIASVAKKYSLILEFPIPRNATPELLEEIAGKLDAKAKENRVKADELLKSAEGMREHADNLRKQAELLYRKEATFSDVALRSAVAHSEGLNIVFQKLGVYKLDALYKEYVAYAESKSEEHTAYGY